MDPKANHPTLQILLIFTFEWKVRMKSQRKDKNGYAYLAMYRGCIMKTTLIDWAEIIEK